MAATDCLSLILCAGMVGAWLLRRRPWGPAKAPRRALPSPANATPYGSRTGRARVLRGEP